MAELKTPESDKTVSRTEQDPGVEKFVTGPTPKGDKKPFSTKHVFMSPTDALTSPCTEKLINLHRYPRRQTRAATKSSLAGSSRPISKLANKENVTHEKEKEESNPTDIQ